ncbi:dienelactone hydrolase family protein [Arthrobacter sp. NPDC097144]|uniref:dienelactone hydrolase family protein n=1 Tax=Arthrobacter sp. NPDC097144 TaxID=3363946 RepID=UPI0038098D80
MDELMVMGKDSAAVHSYVARPEGTPRGGVIVIHEAWGLVSQIRSVADRFAAQGYLAVAPDLLGEHGITDDVATELGEQLFNPDPEQRHAAQPKLRELMSPFRSPDFSAQASARVQSCFEFLESAEGVNGRIGVVGFCMGGTFALSLAVQEARLKACVSFYGRADFSVPELSTVTCPVLAFYGDQDTGLVDKLPDLGAAMTDAGIDFTAEVYPGTGHAFFNDTNRFAYDKDAADDAWRLTLEFLAKTLA